MPPRRPGAVATAACWPPDRAARRRSKPVTAALQGGGVGPCPGVDPHHIGQRAHRAGQASPSTAPGGGSPGRGQAGVARPSVTRPAPSHRPERTPGGHRSMDHGPVRPPPGRSFNRPRPRHRGGRACSGSRPGAVQRRRAVVRSVGAPQQDGAEDPPPGRRPEESEQGLLAPEVAEEAGAQAGVDGAEEQGHRAEGGVGPPVGDRPAVGSRPTQGRWSQPGGLLVRLPVARPRTAPGEASATTTTGRPGQSRVALAGPPATAPWWWRPSTPPSSGPPPVRPRRWPRLPARRTERQRAAAASSGGPAGPGPRRRWRSCGPCVAAPDHLGELHGPRWPPDGCRSD